MNPSPKDPSFTPEEVAIIEKELSAAGISENPSESQLQALSSLLGNDRTSSDLAIYLKRRMINRPIQQQKSPLVVASDNRSSMFKQFAEIKNQDAHPAPAPQKEYICKSKRKVKPTEPLERHSLQEAVQLWDGNAAECHAMFQKKNSKKVGPGQGAGVISENCLWNFHQQFYAILGRHFLKEEPLRRMLLDAEMIPQRMTYHEHRMIRQSLPVPKAFSPEFAAAELQTLAEIRMQARMAPRQKGRESELVAGKEVIALHPVCGHFHSGSILAIYKENQFMVKFQKPELGTQKVMDILMTPRQINNTQRVVIENVDYQIMALALRLLQYKNQLIRLLRQYNARAKQAQKDETPLKNSFFQEYGWVGSTINILSIGIKHVIAKFRLRGLSNANQEKIGKYFSSILINPLNLMEKQLEKSSENSDLYASKQIKSIISGHKENRTEQLTKEYFSKVAGQFQNGGLEGEQKEQMERLLKAMIGILVNLRHDVQNFSMEDNKYLNELMNIIDQRYPEHFNEIYETLHSITSKVSDEVKLQSR